MEKGRRATAMTLRLLTSTVAIATTTTTVVDAVNARATTGTRISPVACRGRPRTGSVLSRGTVAVDTGAPSTEVIDAHWTTSLLAMAPAYLPQATL